MKRNTCGMLCIALSKGNEHIDDARCYIVDGTATIEPTTAHDFIIDVGEARRELKIFSEGFSKSLFLQPSQNAPYDDFVPWHVDEDDSTLRIGDMLYRLAIKRFGAVRTNETVIVCEPMESK